MHSFSFIIACKIWRCFLWSQAKLSCGMKCYFSVHIALSFDTCSTDTEMKSSDLWFFNCYFNIIFTEFDIKYLLCLCKGREAQNCADAFCRWQGSVGSIPPRPLQALGLFVAECEVAGMRVTASISKWHSSLLGKKWWITPSGLGMSCKSGSLGFLGSCSWETQE